MITKHISYNGWNLIKCIDPIGNSYILARCPHCEYSAPDYGDTLEKILFKYCPNCGSKLSEETVITDIDTKYRFVKESEEPEEDYETSFIDTEKEEEPPPELEPDLIIPLTYDVKEELVEGIDECNNLVSSRYVGSLNDERNRAEICKIFSEYLRYFIDKNHLPARASYEVKAVSNSNNSVVIVFPDWVTLNINYNIYPSWRRAE